jgi:hypothetical protein
VHILHRLAQAPPSLIPGSGGVAPEPQCDVREDELREDGALANNRSNRLESSPEWLTDTEGTYTHLSLRSGC